MTSTSHRRAYSALVGLYPRRFRDEYGQDMVLLFEEMAADRGAARVWPTLLRDAFTSIITQRMETLMSETQSRTLTLVGFVSLAVGVVAMALFGSAAKPLFLVLLAALGAGGLAIGLFLRSNAAYREPGQGMHRHWWRYLLAAAACFGAAVIGTEVLNLDGPWVLLFVDIIAGWFLVAMGLALGVWHGAYRLRGVRTA